MTENELKVLQLYADFHREGVRMPVLVRYFARRWIGGTLITIGFCGLILYINRHSPWAPLLLGLILGAILRDIRYLAQYKMQWSIVDDVIDWSKVDQKLRSKA
jgi:hypothetical protein